MAKAEPWEKYFYQKTALHVMSVHSIYRKENKDLKKCLGRLDHKRKQDYFKSLEDAMPKDINAVEMARLEWKLVMEEHMVPADGNVAVADADTDPADAGDRADAHDADPADAGDLVDHPLPRALAAGDLADAPAMNVEAADMAAAWYR